MNTYTIIIHGTGPAVEGEAGSEVSTAQAAVTALVSAGHLIAQAHIQIDKGGDQYLSLA